jgi:dolichyl-phosphate beta-glucosyltransferase
VDLSVIVPCFREPPEVLDSLASIEETLRCMGRDWEMIAVDDASGDGTLERLTRWSSAGDSRRRVIAHPHNTGRGGAVRDGLLAARGRLAGFLDVDLEVGAHNILPMVLLLEAGADVVTVDRHYAIQADPAFLVRHVLSQGYRVLQRAMLALPVADTEAGFKFFRREAILPLLGLARSEGWFWDTEILWLAHRAGLRIREAPAVFLRRSEWPSSVRLASTVAGSLQGLARLARVQHGGGPGPDGR